MFVSVGWASHFAKFFGLTCGSCAVRYTVEVLQAGGPAQYLSAKYPNEARFFDGVPVSLFTNIGWLSRRPVNCSLRNLSMSIAQLILRLDLGVSCSKAFAPEPSMIPWLPFHVWFQRQCEPFEVCVCCVPSKFQGCPTAPTRLLLAPFVLGSLDGARTFPSAAWWTPKRPPT